MMQFHELLGQWRRMRLLKAPQVERQRTAAVALQHVERMHEAVLRLRNGPARTFCHTGCRGSTRQARMRIEKKHERGRASKWENA